MNYSAFLKKIDQLAAGCDAGSLRLFIHEIARTVPESDRQRFLDQLNHYNDDSGETLTEESGPDHEDLSDQINRMIEVLNEINDGDRGLDSDYNEEWDDWNDYSRDEFLFSDPSGVLDDIGLAVSLLHAALDREEYEKGAELAQMLSELTVPVSGEYEDNMQLRDLVNYELLETMADRLEGVVVTGDRTAELHMRIKYAGVPEEKLREDVHAYVSALMEKGLIS